MDTIIHTEMNETKTASAKRKAVFVLLLGYMLIVLCYTVILRDAGFCELHPELFWSYKKWLAGNRGLNMEILGNIAMFIPFGFLLAAAMPFRKRTGMVTAAAGFLFSCAIEFLQYELMRGVFESDDILNNTLGAILGYLFYKATEKVTSKKTDLTTTVLVLGALFVAGGIGVCFRDYGGDKAETANIPSSVCFQVDKAELRAGELTLTGFAFIYGREMKDPGLILKSTKTGKEVKTTVQYGLPRPDVNRHFRNGGDYSGTGFTAKASGINTDGEYEIFIRTGRFVSIPTGVYVTGNRIHYAKQDCFTAPDVAGTGLEEIVNNGYLRVYRPDRACYVYQHKGYLYWIADTAFAFEEDGATYIQYHLWTTQTEKLPDKRLKNQWYWDNIGGFFEKHEITKQINCGRYRVSRRKLPDAYSVTSVLTGYHKNGKWVWRNYFRPVYEFRCCK